ncbi:hypothetical protein BACCOP_03914 [Phocaeicola coprocola DSM 17136]|uniref:Uncharacterized protein n=1 Tax=Phocaeicola coprocola DSM 17136 TaxID=470145 RepID=B3JPF3_9BACT|nr:hypothetical protein BACCOP_03914 [Phocaeicola coprocola DSM 17136]
MNKQLSYRIQLCRLSTGTMLISSYSYMFIGHLSKPIALLS